MELNEENIMLENLSESIDTALIEWMTTFKMPALNLTAVILARLTWMSKMGNYQEDFIGLLRAPQEILAEEQTIKQVH
jgi:hypothetical protein